MKDSIRIIHSIQEMQEYRKLIGNTKNVGFVPTMGYLHEGHLSLVERSNKESDITIVSIYVNPSQFGANEDLSKYPRDLDRDLDLLGQYNVDAVFYPNNDEMYPSGYLTWIEVEQLSRLYCGHSRPGHFRGVTTIVAKLINIVKPDYMYMGEKDFQQIAVLKQMIRDLNMDTIIRECPIVREADGLAKSSRNVYLSSEERRDALCLYESLLKAKELIFHKETSLWKIKDQMIQHIHSKNGQIDYIEFIHPDTLKVLEKVEDQMRIIMAVYIGKTRLIDNMGIELV